jgi:hypothetical protein
MNPFKPVGTPFKKTMNNNNNNNKLTRAQILSLQLTQIQMDIIYGCLLGDLHAEKRNINGNTRLQFRYSSKYNDYINHLYSVFKDFTGSPPINLSYFDNRPNKMERYYSVKFQTLSLPCFNIFRNIFYNENGVKIIPLNYSDYLTPRGLAYWIMDDGYYSTNTNGIYLCTDSFTLVENELLVNILNTKFNFNAAIHKHTNGNRIYIPSGNIESLISLVKPFMLPLFYYKLGL